MGDEIDFKYYYRHQRSYVRRGIFSVDEPSPTIRGVNRPMPKGYQLHPNDPCQSLDGIRPLTTQERSRIQTFPKDFIFSGSKTDQEQMIGNAVPVNLARFVGQAIQEYIAQKDNSRMNIHIQTATKPQRYTIPEYAQSFLFEDKAKYKTRMS